MQPDQGQQDMSRCAVYLWARGRVPSGFWTCLSRGVFGAVPETVESGYHEIRPHLMDDFITILGCRGTDPFDQYHAYVSQN